MARPEMFDRVTEFMRAFPGPGVVAISGGADSVALAFLLKQNHHISLAHLNHGLRGADSDADQAFVASLAEQWRVPYRTEKLDVRTLSAGANMEASARSLRYLWLAQICSEEKAHWVATGHTADDQAETVLFRILRGSGMRGLRGILPQMRLADGVTLIRPMLSVSRSEILDLIERNGLTFCHDASNDDLSLARNRIRHQLLPMLKETINPQLARILQNLAEECGDLVCDLDQQAEALRQLAELPRAGSTLVLDVMPLRNARPYLVGEVLRSIWRREGWPLDGMNRAAWRRMFDLIAADTGQCDFAGSIRARRVANVLQLSPGSSLALREDKRQKLCP